MVFVVDAFGTWLVEQLADAGRKKLTALILGDEQERALRRAADAAIRATAAEISPSDGGWAEQAVGVIGQVFDDPVPDAPRAGPVMLLEGLHTRIARQLAVLDDASVTGTGQSSADVLGVPGAVLADRLTSHLVREILVSGSRGSPLTALAGQLNHELTRLQGQRIESELARLADEIRDTRALPGGSMTPAGRLLEEVTDPFAVEVHRPVQLEDSQPGLRELPAYVPREHDALLEQVVRRAAGGRSGIAVLVGGSSTGKTRACWEALRVLRAQPGQWRLWHPIDPTRPDAALRELPAIGPRTVIWLNEAQYYLDQADGALGERVAAGLRELLRGPAARPGAGAGDAVAPVLGHPDRPPSRGCRPPRRGAGTAGWPRHHRARRFHPRAAGPARQDGGCAAGLGRHRCGGRAGNPVPGRGAGVAGPVPERAARSGGADRRGDGCPSAWHGAGAATAVHGSRHARVPD